jgi:hypothetical protein
MKNYPDYETLCEEYQSGNISAVDFVTQQSDEMTQEYYDFCKDESLDYHSEAAAKAFMDYREALFEESIGN